MALHRESSATPKDETKVVMWRLPCGEIVTDTQFKQAIAFYSQRCRTVKEVIDQVDDFFKPIR